MQFLILRIWNPENSIVSRSYVYETSSVEGIVPHLISCAVWSIIFIKNGNKKGKGFPFV